MKKIIVSAKSQNNVIGKGNGIPWKMDCDVQFLEKVVASQTIIFGRTTFESMKEPYEGAEYIIITRKEDYNTVLPSYIVNSIDGSFACADEHNEYPYAFVEYAKR